MSKLFEIKLSLTNYLPWTEYEKKKLNVDFKKQIDDTRIYYIIGNVENSQKILYIGSTRQNMVKRLAFNHRGFIKALRDGWKEQNLGVSFGFYQEPLVLPKEVEGYLINKYKPIYNASTPNFKIIKRVDEFGSFPVPKYFYDLAGSRWINDSGEKVDPKTIEITTKENYLDWRRYIDNLDGDGEDNCYMCKKDVQNLPEIFLTNKIYQEFTRKFSELIFNRFQSFDRSWLSPGPIDRLRRQAREALGVNSQVVNMRVSRSHREVRIWSLINNSEINSENFVFHKFCSRYSLGDQDRDYLNSSEEEIKHKADSFFRRLIDSPEVPDSIKEIVQNRSKLSKMSDRLKIVIDGLKNPDKSQRAKRLQSEINSLQAEITSLIEEMRKIRSRLSKSFMEDRSRLSKSFMEDRSTVSRATSGLVPPRPPLPEAGPGLKTEGVTNRPTSSRKTVRSVKKFKKPK